MSEQPLVDQFAHDLALMARECWAAGVLDARGRWVCLRRRSLDPRIELRVRGSRWPTPNDPMLRTMQEHFNGSITITKHGTAIWQVTGAQRCAVVNAAVLPYLVTFRDRAKAHQRICMRIIEYKKTSFESRRLPREEQELRLELLRAFEAIP